jgi:hypothetical protein
VLAFHPDVEPPETISFMQGGFADIADISGVFTFFCELLTLYRVSVDISFFQLQHLP